MGCYGHPLTAAKARDVLAGRRQAMQADAAVEAPSIECLADEVRSGLQSEAGPRLHRVINATGVVLHTNLGRAPLATRAAEAAALAATGYSNLEFDLQAGRRGARTQGVEPLLCEVTGRRRRWR